MFNRLCIAGILGYSLIASAENIAQQDVHYSRRDLKTLIQTAHTPEQYKALQAYFRKQAEHFSSLAESQRNEMRYAQEHFGGAKYPTAYDRAHQLSFYYQQRADKASARAQEYENRLQSGEATGATR
jgi:hypothetical protein